MGIPCRAHLLLFLMICLQATLAAAQDPTPIPGDLNRDGRVDQDDLVIFRAQWHAWKELPPTHPPSATLTPTETPLPSATPSVTPSPTEGPSQTPTPTNPWTPSPTPTSTEAPGGTPTSTSTPTSTPTGTWVEEDTPTPTPPLTATETPAASPSSTPTFTPTETPVEVETPTPSATSPGTATATSTPTRTPSPAATDTPGPSPTATPTATLPSVTPLPTFIAELPGGATLEFVLIPAGSFMMGGATDEGWNDYQDNERPVHPVTINSDFYIGRYEVTQAQWEAVMGGNPSTFSECGPDCPVETVSWNDCQTFVEALNLLGLGTFRLPSEAEWEYACRGGSTARFFFGDSTCSPTGCDACDLGNYAWWCGNDGVTRSKETGRLLPNPFGLYDILGNVEEWCEDDWHSSYSAAPSDGSAWVDSPRGANRVLRGGFWNYQAKFYRSASRDYSPPGTVYQGNGVRLVREVP